MMMIIKETKPIIYLLFWFPFLISSLVTPEKVPFEAVFQGLCEEIELCQQLCYNLHDGTFECECESTYTLDSNGYSCTKKNVTQAESSVLYKKETSYVAILKEEDYQGDEGITEEKGEANWGDDVKYSPGDVPKKKPPFTTLQELNREESDSNSFFLNDDEDESDELYQSGDYSNDDEQRTKFVTLPKPNPDKKIAAPCQLDCGAGKCFSAGIQSGNPDEGDRNPSKKQRCQCSLGKSGPSCGSPATSEISVAKFRGSSWASFAPLREAYRDVQISLEFLPESSQGVLLVSGENDDLSGDFMAAVLIDGFVNFKWDCGSGSGSVQSPDRVKLNEWNRITVYRHRWDVWLQLNNGNHVQGRSEGLFSRITFREPLYVGGSYNLTSLGVRLGVGTGFEGCIKKLQVNDHLYKFYKKREPVNDVELVPDNSSNTDYTATDGWDITECSAEACSAIECFHGGRCVTSSTSSGSTSSGSISSGSTSSGSTSSGSDSFGSISSGSTSSGSTSSGPISSGSTSSGSTSSGSTSSDSTSSGSTSTGSTSSGSTEDGVPVCICPLGYSGNQCERPLNLEVPSFNGSSLLVFPPLKNSVLSWLEIDLVFKPTTTEGLLLYASHAPHAPRTRAQTGDLLAVALTGAHVLLTLDLGSGPLTLRSLYPVAPNMWHTLKVSRTGRRTWLYVDDQLPVEGETPGAFTMLSLSQPLYLGGYPHASGGYLHSGDYPQASESGDYHHLANTPNFIGCIQKLKLSHQKVHLISGATSGVNVGSCDHPCSFHPCANGGRCDPIEESYSCRCPLGYNDPHCRSQVVTQVATPSFSGRSFLKYNEPDILKRISGDKLHLWLRFRSTGADGLILWMGSDELAQNVLADEDDDENSVLGDFLALELRDARLVLRYNLGSGVAFLAYNGSHVADGEWHTVKLTRFERTAHLTLDEGPMLIVASPGDLVQLNVDTPLYIGGIETYRSMEGGSIAPGLKGCVADLILATDYHVDLMNQAEAGQNIDYC